MKRTVYRDTARRAAVIAGSAALIAAAMGSPAQAETPQPGEYLNCITNVAACAAANDASPWALGMAQWLFRGEGMDGTRADAFRHCAWSGAITQRVGAAAAEDVTTAHETNAPDRDNLDDYASMGMDLANNATGRTVGERANAEGGSDTWGWIINECYSRATTGQLVVLR